MGGTGFLYQREFGLGVGGKAVERHHHRQAEHLLHIVDVFQQIGQTLAQGVQIFFAQIGTRHAAVVFQCPHGGHHHRYIRTQAGEAAFDVAEFFCPQIGAEAGFGNRVIAQLLRHPGGDYRIAAVGDVGKRAAVHQRRRAAQGLHQIGADGIFEQRRHGAVCFQFVCIHRLAVAAVGYQHPPQALFQIGQIARQAKHLHHFRSHGDVETVGAHYAVGAAAQPADELAQLAVVHVQHPPPQHPLGVDVQGIALVDMVVEHGRQQVVGRADGVEVAGEMQIDVFHRQHLGITAAGRPALDAEYRPQRRLAHRHHRLLSQPLQGVGQTDGDRGFALAGRCGVDGGNQHQPPLFGRQRRHRRRVDFGFVAAIVFQRLRS